MAYELVIDELTQLEHLQSKLLPVDAGLVSLPKLLLTSAQIHALQHGQPALNIAQPKAIYRLYSESNEFIGVGEVTADGRLVSKRLLQFRT